MFCQVLAGFGELLHSFTDGHQDSVKSMFSETIQYRKNEWRIFLFGCLPFNLNSCDCLFLLFASADKQSHAQGQTIGLLGLASQLSSSYFTDRSFPTNRFCVSDKRGKSVE
jgi:hypothetical protein